MAALLDLIAKIEALTGDVTALGAAIDLLIASDVANFEALKAALASGDAVAIDAAIASIDAARATLAATKDKVTAADQADDLPVPPPPAPPV